MSATGDTPARMSATQFARVRDAIHHKQLRLTWDEAAALLADRDRLAVDVHQANVEINLLSNANRALARQAQRLISGLRDATLSDGEADALTRILGGGL